MRPAAVGPSWLELFQPGTPGAPPTLARVLVVSDVVGALTHMHTNVGSPAAHRRHGRVTPRHILVGLDGGASLTYTKSPFSTPLPAQPDLGYLAPEILSGSTPANQESDVFGAGVLLWEALDNGRLFPHRQPQAIRQLIARQSLPSPRISEEWAHALAPIAMRALSLEPSRRFADATALWRELRNCLPPSEEARDWLSRAVQGLLEFTVTDQISASPPYLVPFRGSNAPEKRDPSSYSLPPSGRHARYSLQPTQELEVRSPGGTSKASSGPTEETARRTSLAPASTPRRSEPSPQSEVVQRSPRSRSPKESSADSPTRMEIQVPSALLHSSVPFLLSSHPAPASSPPWGLVALAGMAFFAVGAAVALGAVNALRPAMPGPVPSVSASSAPAGAPVVPAPSSPPVVDSREISKHTPNATSTTGTAKRSTRRAKRSVKKSHKRPGRTAKKRFRARRTKSATELSKPTQAKPSDLPFAKTPF